MAGIVSVPRRAMIAMTTSSSIKVNACIRDVGRAFSIKTPAVALVARDAFVFAEIRFTGYACS
jgi:hypothetical protein